MSGELRLGFIGSGEFSVLHAEAVARSEGAILNGIWNRTRDKAVKRAEQFGCRVFDTPEELVTSPDIDAVFVLTNLETHVKYVKLALDAGKHVFVEKPVANSSEEIHSLMEISVEKGLYCVPGHNMIHEAGIKRIKDLIHSGRVGKLVSIYVMYNMFHSEEIASRYPGVIRQIFTHNLYTLLYLGGIPEKVSAFKTILHYDNYNQEDLAEANIKLKKGALAHISASFAADDLSSDPWTFLIKVIGTKGSARYSYQDWVESGKDAYHTHTYTAYQDTVNNEVQYFINLCRNGGEPLSSMMDAFIAQRTMEAIEESIENEKVVTVDF